MNAMGAGSRSRSILLIAQGAPPSTTPGTRRVAGLTRYLAELGHEVTVLTSIMYGRGSGKWGAARVVRTRDALASPLLEKRRRWKGRSADAGDTAETPEIRPSRLWTLFVPDAAVATWIPFALPRALHLASTHGCDCVITTAPPRSVHLIGLGLHARGIPWIADFRDGWRFETVERPLSPAAARLDARLEELVASRADVVTAVTPSLTRDFAGRLQARAVTVTNGFDPAEAATAAPKSDLLARDRHSLVFTGSIRPPQFSPFARALGVISRERPDLMARFEVVFVGPRWVGVTEVAAEEGLTNVRWLPPVSRAEALTLQRQADSLLVLLEPERPGVVTTKLYEYLAADRTMLVVGPEGDAAEILDDAGGGFFVSPTPERLSWGLEKLLAGEEPPRGRTGREAYAYPRIAARMAEQVEVAIAHRGSAGGRRRARRAQRAR